MTFAVGFTIALYVIGITLIIVAEVIWRSRSSEPPYNEWCNYPGCTSDHLDDYADDE